MIRYRSPSTVPAPNAPPSIESEEASRPTGTDEGLRRATAAATEGEARPVGARETELTAWPHTEQ